MANNDELQPNALWGFGRQYKAIYYDAQDRKQTVELPACRYTLEATILPNRLPLSLVEQNRILRTDIERLYERINELVTEKITWEDDILQHIEDRVAAALGDIERQYSEDMASRFGTIYDRLTHLETTMKEEMLSLLLSNQLHLSQSQH